jgi:membrane protein
MTVSKPYNFFDLSSLKAWTDRPIDDSSLFTSAVHYLLRILFITLAEFEKSELSLRSSALTYTILLSLVPMLAMSTAVVKGLGGGDQLRKVTYTYIASLERDKGAQMSDPGDQLRPMAVPQPAEKIPDLTGHLRTAVDKLFDYVDRTNFTTLGTIGMVGILISVLLVLGHIESAMNAIWKVSTARSLQRKISDYLTLMILLPISINITFAASAFLNNPVLASKMDILIPFDWLQSLLLKPIPILFITLTFYAIYIFFPNTKVKNRPAVIGALLAALLWFSVQNVYINLQVGVANYNAIYGSFASLPLFLVWIYLGWLFILTGAQVAYAFQNEKTYRLLPFKGSPSVKLGAAFDVMDHIYSAFTKHQPVTARNLADALPHYAPLMITDTLDELMKAGMIHVSQTDDRLLPMSPIEEYDRQIIVSIILGTDAPDTTGGIMSRKAIEAARAESSLHDPGTRKVSTPD